MTGDRKPHRLKRPVRHARPEHVVFVDTETYVHHVTGVKSYHRLRLGWACYQRYRPKRRKYTVRWLQFTDVVDFWEWIGRVTPRRVTVWVMSCNLAFDWHILDGWGQLPKHGARVTFFYCGQGVKIIQAVGWGRRWCFTDTINVLPVSVAALGDHLGKPKMDVDWSTPDDDLLSDYCRRDVEIIQAAYNAWCDFIEVNDYGPVAWTLAGQAFATYRYRFMHHDIFIHGQSEINRLERRAYFGGRTEAYRIGRYDKTDVIVLDVNSMYPAVMAGNRYPCRLVGSGRHLPLVALPDKLNRYMVVATVKLDTDEPVYPVRSTRTIFPVGRFTTTLTTPELLYAVEHGHVTEVLAWSDYDGADLFTDYVQDVAERRDGYKRDGNTLYSFICKRLHNSLYGKFGQYSTEWIDVGHNGTIECYQGLYGDVETGEVLKERCFFGWVEREAGTYEARNSFPAISAHVTAYARLALWSLICRAGQHNVLYVDTDSLMVNPSGLRRLRPCIDPYRLGALKVEKRLKWVEVFTVKDYRSDQGIKLKGVPKSAKEISPGVYEHEWFPGFASLLREQVSGEYPISLRLKTLKREYLKGDVHKDGTVTPYRLDQ